MNIKLHVERLILDGPSVAPAEQPMLKTAVETELTRLLLAKGELPSKLQGERALPLLQAGGIQLDGEGNLAHLGAKIARAVCEGIMQ